MGGWPAHSVVMTPEAVDDISCCPITQEAMRDPVICADGHTYERSAIAQWLEVHDTSPMTNKKLEHKMLVSNMALRKILQYVTGTPGA
ncbi:hypothetical protein WJX72_010369 [[Myrmecia] bisecta]|uniref:U-box domain-containing protein n=1 Tax=[Myrmecia] bisecta TaxID=41462 RepID=A0AAW1QBY7_9CHLO